LDVFIAACISMASSDSVRSVIFFSNFARLVAELIDMPSSRSSASLACRRGGRVGCSAGEGGGGCGRAHLGLRLGAVGGGLHRHALHALDRRRDLVQLLRHGIVLRARSVSAED